MATAGVVAVTGISAGQFCPNGFPQASLPLECGGGGATCFSGFLNQWDPPAGVDPDGFVVAVVDFRDPAVNAPGTGQNWCAPMLHNEFPVTADTWSAANLGQVFGVTLDSDNPPNIYVTATTGYGSDDPTYQNFYTVALPASPFGPGGSGAVYQLNGTTGASSPLATFRSAGPPLSATAWCGMCFRRTGSLEARSPGRQQQQEILDADHAIAVEVLGSAGVAPCGQ
ncbi:MAG: hypothetical protein ACYTGF_01660 [Planctomycetota bacterium]